MEEVQISHLASYILAGKVITVIYCAPGILEMWESSKQLHLCQYKNSTCHITSELNETMSSLGK